MGQLSVRCRFARAITGGKNENRYANSAGGGFTSGHSDTYSAPVAIMDSRALSDHNWYIGVGIGW